MTYLTKVTEVYRLSTEKEAETFLKELKSSTEFELAKYTSTKKQRKAKGEVIDEWIHFEATKVFNDEKEPNCLIGVNYELMTIGEDPMISLTATAVMIEPEIVERDSVGWKTV